MAGSPRTPLLLLAVLALALALALAVSPAAGQGARKKGLVGGLMEADVNEKGVQEAVSFAITEYNKQSNDAYQSRAVRVVRAFKQVVSGMNYFLDVEIGRTTCTKSQDNLDNCPFHDQPQLKKQKLCNFHVHVVPWLNTISLMNFSCQDESGTGHQAGR
ncbi:cystatin-C [Tursiops truncatus]|uniref:Cystatin-C-like n=1 Tax=Tursiops truncatus TaxID=9739 RepID=A0A2U4AQ84_TURTR|nr:cystatin-C-like [Tursiops truncatus]